MWRRHAASTPRCIFPRRPRPCTTSPTTTWPPSPPSPWWRARWRSSSKVAISPVSTATASTFRCSTRNSADFDFGRSKFIDVQTIYHKREPRTLTAAYRYYCGKDLEDAHSALADTRATYEVLLAQLEHYGDLPENVDELSEYASQNKNVDFMGRLIYDENGCEVINFGKYKGRKAEDVLRTDPGYYSWIMGGDFTNNTKMAFTRIKLRAKK